MNFLDFLIEQNDKFLELFGTPGTMLYRMGYVGEWFIGCFILFYFLAKLFPSIKQPAIPSGMGTDAIYWFGGPIVYTVIFIAFANYLSTFPTLQNLNSTISFYMHSYLPIQKAEHGKMHFSDLLQVNVAIQALLILLISDVIQYWLHRWFHNSSLWDYHAIHHAPTHLDWTTSVRFHPINIILYSTSVNAFVAIMGFDTEAFLLLQPFNMLYSPLVHANLNWSYGPFKYIIASPIFHRWHHTHTNEGGMKNFAPTFSFLDVMFGTFYMPKDKRPEVFGIEGNPVPNDFIGQVMHPFKQKKS